MCVRSDQIGDYAGGYWAAHQLVFLRETSAARRDTVAACGAQCQRSRTVGNEAKAPIIFLMLSVPGTRAAQAGQGGKRRQTTVSRRAGRRHWRACGQKRAHVSYLRAVHLQLRRQATDLHRLLQQRGVGQPDRLRLDQLWPWLLLAAEEARRYGPLRDDRSERRGDFRATNAAEHPRTVGSTSGPQPPATPTRETVVLVAAPRSSPPTPR